MSLTVIAGATATGKSDLAVDVACALIESGREVHIVNADAMQLYRGMNIGTAKITLAERRGVPHHLLDVLEITQESTVAGYRAAARPLIDDLLHRGADVIVVGGSGFYLDALLTDQVMPGTDPQIRVAIEQQVEAHGVEPVYLRLQQLDPAAAARIDRRNVRRVVRALEVCELTGQPFSSFRTQRSLWRDHHLFLLECPKPELDERIAQRTRAMWQAGFVDEVRALLATGLRHAPTALRATGYPQAIAQIDGELTEQQAIDATVQATVRLTKKQRTWFRHHGDATVLVSGDPHNVSRLVNAIVESSTISAHESSRQA